jgi:hypothetical protein
VLEESLGLFIALMMEAASTTETSASFYQTARRINPEDSHLVIAGYFSQYRNY